jgi:L-iditol 2-dehydrogenase
VERREPEAAAGQAVLEVLACGVCGSDLKIESGAYPCSAPVILGHEVAGRVERVGEGVDEGWLGARVVCETYFSTCGSCEWCSVGRPNLCPERLSIGTHVDGGFCARMALPVANLHSVPDRVDEHAAALFEPLACVTHCFRSPSAVTPGDRVAVVGPGAIGALAAQVARARGGDVLVCGLAADAHRLDVLGSLGFRTALELGDVPFDVVVDASGSEGGIAAGLEAVRRGGRFVQIGIAGRPVTVPLDLILLREIEVHAGFASTPRSWQAALELVEAGDVRLEPLISDVVPLGDWQRVFADLKSSRGMKVVIDPRVGANGGGDEHVG